MKIFDKLHNSTNRVESEISAVDGGLGGESMNTIFIGSREPGFLDYRGNNWSLILGVSTEDAFRSVSSLRAQFIIVAAIILSISTFLVFLFARSISRPIIASMSFNISSYDELLNSSELLLLILPIIIAVDIGIAPISNPPTDFALNSLAMMSYSSSPTSVAPTGSAKTIFRS